jgi:lycopene cyclase domain-containing protein
VAVIYTTPWDNYLVATGVWYYNPDLVTGVTLGWVPIEEYTFFILQTLMTGLLFHTLARRIRLTDSGGVSGWKHKVVFFLVSSILWLGVLTLFLSDWRSGTYISLILLWALPPVMLQFLYGGDILWRGRKVVGLTLLAATLYLSLTDSLAIHSGTWTIDPEQSLNIFLANVLPLEEFVFFLCTNCLLVFGMTLFMASGSWHRILRLSKKILLDSPID